MTRIRFRPNEPVTLKLADPQGEYDFELQTGRYQTVDGREVQLPRAAVIKLNELAPAAGEEIGICRYENAKRDSWAVWLTATSEKDRAIAEIDHSELEQQLSASIEQINGSKPAKEAVTPIRRKQASKSPDECQPRLFDRGTGTDGPAPAIQPAAILKPATLRKGVPYQDMLRAIVRTVKSVLESEKLQLGDDPTQKIIVTLYIDAARRSGVVYDFGSAE